MPLSKDKLTTQITKKTKNEYEKYKDGDTGSMSHHPIGDSVVEHMHDEIEEKLKEIVKLQLELITVTGTALAAITPPGNGAVGAGVLNAQSTKIIGKLNTLLADLNDYRN